MLLASLYVDDIQNSVAATKSGGAQSFFAENRKVWTDPAKNTHKIKYVEQVEIDVHSQGSSRTK
jgi:hypothetical protein